MPEWFIKYIGGGLLAVIGYVIISNTLWLIFGSRLLQSLPGVNIKGAKGTLRIAIMILMSFVALFVWFFNYLFHIIGISKKRTISSWISFFIQLASKIFSKALNKDN